MFAGSIIWKGIVYTILMILGKGSVAIVIYSEHIILNIRKDKSASIDTARIQRESIPTNKSGTPHSTALLVGSAMVARGEIGFLIASLSQSSGTLVFKTRNGTNTQTAGEDVFLVIVWAVVLCTIIGKENLDSSDISVTDT